MLVWCVCPRSSSVLGSVLGDHTPQWGVWSPSEHVLDDLGCAVPFRACDVSRLPRHKAGCTTKRKASTGCREDCPVTGCVLAAAPPPEPQGPGLARQGVPSRPRPSRLDGCVLLLLLLLVRQSQSLLLLQDPGFYPGPIRPGRLILLLPPPPPPPPPRACAASPPHTAAQPWPPSCPPAPAWPAAAACRPRW